VALLQRAQSVGSGGQCWVGYKQDLKPCQLGLMLAVEPSFSVFYEPKLLPDYCEAVLSPNERQQWRWPHDGLMRPNDIRQVDKSLKGLTVRASLPAPPCDPAHRQGGRVCLHAAGQQHMHPAAQSARALYTPR
jgi:hypothetical protein